MTFGDDDEDDDDNHGEEETFFSRFNILNLRVYYPLFQVDLPIDVYHAGPTFLKRTQTDRQK